MSESNALEPLEQRTVVFYDDEITAVLVDVDGRQSIYVPIRPICEQLGLAWSSQLQRLRRDPILGEEILGVFVTNTPGIGGGTQEMICLPLDFLNGWLFGVSANRVRDDIRPALLRYQRECYRVLAAAFTNTATSVTDDWMATSPESRAALLQIREMGQAIMQMAEEQLRIVQRLDKAAIVVGQHGHRISSLEQRLAPLERQISPHEAITDEQASDIAQKVKAVGMMLTEEDSSRNQFQAIFSELHRRFRVTSYKNIRQNQYQAVLDFLDEWLAAANK